jgi:hypothetical protein
MTIDIDKLNRLHEATDAGWQATNKCVFRNGDDGSFLELLRIWDYGCGSDAKFIAAIQNAWPEIAKELQSFDDLKRELPRLYKCAKEWQVYSEQIESETDAAMAAEMQDLRRKYPKAINQLKDALDEIQRLRSENERLKAEITSINEHGLPPTPHDLSDAE